MSYSKKNVKQSNKEPTTPERKSSEDVIINQSAVISNAPRASSAGGIANAPRTNVFSEEPQPRIVAVTNNQNANNSEIDLLQTPNLQKKKSKFDIETPSVAYTPNKKSKKSGEYFF